MDLLSPQTCGVMFKAITTNNAANMLKATKSAKTINAGLGCIDHTLQLVINTCIAKCPEVLTAVNNFKRYKLDTMTIKINQQ